ncbi:PPPDE putative peptidase domain-containing protein [Lyophyllum atratum]|nr:PPPDE putative peptidase domain-containing protein [Lyophyllum atratum]
MSTPVKLYVYDLSNGMARQLSQQLTGRQIDGIWHTSVVVYGKEVFYGQGIHRTQPGRSHHGSPLQVVDMGETSTDEETFNEYLTEMEDHYTADKYHLLDFNCNSFTNDLVGFLTGGSIPEYIKDLPTDFLATPFGAALRPTIDAMFRRPSPGAPTPPVPPPVPAENAGQDPHLTASILQAVAAQAQASTSTPATQTLTAPIHVISNPPAFHSFLKNHRAAVALFTDATCGPCRMIAPVYEKLSEEKGVKADGTGAGFAKIDIRIGQGQALASEWGIRATPTFIFYLDGKKLDELKGADANELRTQIDLLLYQAFPPHPHTSLSLPAVQALSLNPILFTQVPAIDTVLTKLSTFIDSTPWPSIPQTPAQVKQTLTETVAPYLKARFSKSPTTTSPKLPSATPALLTSWSQATSALTTALPTPSLFPLVDLWRLALLDPSVGNWSAPSSPSDPIHLFIDKATAALRDPGPAENPRNYLLTVLRLLSNAFATPALAQQLLLTTRAQLGGVLVPSLLHADAAVRTAAAGLMFNVAAFLQKGRVGGGNDTSKRDGLEDEEWEVEMVSAVVEALERETASEDVVHRLTASLAFLLRLSPAYDEQIAPLLEVLQARDVLRRKLGKGGCGEEGVRKKEVRRLVEEVADKLCP